ncbi:MAG: hypothetical protein AAF226_17535 [Verrucomicrobiota bacterium]
MSPHLSRQNLLIKKSADLWDSLSPIFVKDLRQGMRANVFVWPFTALQIVALVITCIDLMVSSELSTSGGFLFGGGLMMEMMRIVFWGLLPLTLFGSLQSELGSGRNVELLLMSNLSRWQIVLGKWGVGSVLSLLMLVSLIPYVFTRYYLGNIDVIQMLLQIGSMIVGNVLANAIVIGCSGFRNYVGRVFMILWIVGTCAVTYGIGVAAVSVSSMVSGTTSRGMIVWISLAAICSAALFIVMGLQLGRARLKLFDDPLDPPATGLIIVLIVCSPIVIGIATAISAGYAGWVGALIMAVLAVIIDPGPGKKKRRFAQP